MEVEREALEYIQRYLRYGFYRPDEVERVVGEDVFDGAIPRKRLRELVKAEVSRQQAEQKSWPAVTDCDRLDKAFVALEAEGILALHNAGLTPSEGIDEMSERYYAAGGRGPGSAGIASITSRTSSTPSSTTNSAWRSATSTATSAGVWRSARGSGAPWRRPGCVSPGPAPSTTSWTSRNSAGSGGTRPPNQGLHLTRPAVS